MAELSTLDRKGNVIQKGSKIKLVGSHDDSINVFFASDMEKYLNNEKPYTIKIIEDKHIVKLKELDWCWDVNNIEKLPFPPQKKIKPILFEVSMLDI